MLKIGRRLAVGVPSRGDLGGQAEVLDRLQPIGTLLEVMGELLGNRTALCWCPDLARLAVQRHEAFAEVAVESGSVRGCLAAIQYFAIERVLKLVALGDVAAGDRFGVRDPEQLPPPGKRIAPFLEVLGIQIPRCRTDQRSKGHARDTAYLEDSLVIGAECLNLGLDHLAEALGDLQVETRQGTPQLPCPLRSFD